jgi:hypothetical protein
MAEPDQVSILNSYDCLLMLYFMERNDKRASLGRIIN